MTREAFEQEILYRLKAQRLRTPVMQPEDVVKLVFQAMLGVGHLLSAREKVTQYIVREMNALLADPEEPLFEILSPAWCRLNLRRAMAANIQPQVIAGLMLTSGCEISFTRQEVYDCCKRIAQSGDYPLKDDKALDAILDAQWLPSHSAAYREEYHPAYRVISTDWIPCLEAIQRIAEKAAAVDRLLITLDGPCASGKTTLAQKLAKVFQGEVVHTDDFVIPHALKTPERLAVPGGNCDAERLAKEVVIPFKYGMPVKYRRYSCMKDALLPEQLLPDSRLLILEGSYCNLPAIQKYADVRLFLDAPWETREARLLKRESAASMQQFYDRWIPLENAYFEAYRLPDDGVVLINGR
jgi:uridine kinase